MGLQLYENAWIKSQEEGVTLGSHKYHAADQELGVGYTLRHPRGECVQSIMAEKTLKNLEDQLNCAICLDTYTEPKVLQCHHVYCRKCLVRLVVRNEQGQLILTCPKCRHDTPIPADGVGGLQSAFEVNHLLEIIDKYKKNKDAVSSIKGAEDDVASSTSSKKLTPYCSEHEGKELELYCEKCEELICYKCVYKGGKHHNHDSEQIEVLVEKYKGEITSLLKPMEEELTIVNKALAQLDTCSGEIYDQRAAIEANIHDKIQQLHEFLDVRKTELIGQLHRITQRKLKGLATQRDQIETTQVQMSSCLNFVRERLNTGSNGEVLKMKTRIVKQVKELTSAFQLDTLKPITKADITFSVSPDVIAGCQNYGKVYAARDPDPSKCHATGKGLEEAAVGKKSKALIQAFDYMGTPCTELIKSLQCEVISDITGTKAQVSVKRRGQNQYKIKYQPTIKGRNQLHIKINSQHIKGSPFPVSVKLPIDQLGIPIQIICDVNRPMGVTVNQKGEVIVSEFYINCVSVFSPTGEKFKSFGTSGSDHGQFSNSGGVAVDGEENILVLDYENHRIQKFTANGHFLTAVGTKGNRPLQFDHPAYIAYNASNNKLYVTDPGNNRVQVLNSNLTFSSTFGKKGSGKGEFNDPCGIACNSTGKVYISEHGNNRIQVFTADGTFLSMFGRHGSARGELNGPCGITLDVNDIVYVSEFKNHRVSVFTSEGQFVSSFGSQGSQQGELDYPTGIAVDNSGVIYVCDVKNCCIKIF